MKPSVFSRFTPTLATFLMVSVLSALTVLPTEAAIAKDGSDDGATRRVALVIGHHDGGAGRERLTFAGSDASTFRRTLEELGGLRSGDATLLVDPDSARVSRALDDMEERTRALKREGRRVEAIVYYSGHADDKGFKLGREGFEYRAFRSRLNSLGADVRIAVVDACESGALTRLKGGKPAPAFLVDKSIRSEGYAILTSSSENEAAQESDRVGGSFFTHALNTGLRGAADASRDGKVTLHEAYQFAFNETLARTQSSRGGPQHAGYEIQLTGSGDVVLTDLREASASLELSKDLYGRLFIRDSLDHLTAELNKPAGAEMKLGLAPGTYGLRLLQGDVWNAATVVLSDGAAAPITPALFRQVGAPPAMGLPQAKTFPDTGFQHVSQDAPGGFSSGLLYDWVKTEWRGTQLAPIGTGARSNVRGGQLSLGFNSVGGDLEGFQGAIGANVGLGSIRGLQISSGANLTAKHMTGVQLATGVNLVGERLEGAQISTGFNSAGHGIKGWQGSVGANVSGNGVLGGQATVGANIAADSVKGAQLAVGLNIAGDSLRGGQATVVLNIVAGHLVGGQGAAILNITADKVRGGQGSGIMNIAAGRVEGGQGAGVANVAGGLRGGQGAGVFNLSFGAVKGFQAAGVLNASSDMQGAQIAGVLNIASRVDGYQIGLLNISDSYESGVPVGLLNVSRKDGFAMETWAEENGMVFAGIRTNARWMHSHLAAGTKPLRDGPRLLAPTIGVSADCPLGPQGLRGEIGLLHSMVFEPAHPTRNGDFVEDGWSRLRAGVSYRLLPYLVVAGGLSYNVAVHEYTDAPVMGHSVPFFKTYDNTVSLWPGAWAGVRIGK